MDPGTLVAALLLVAVTGVATAVVRAALRRRALQLAESADSLVTPAGCPHEYDWVPPPDRYSFATLDLDRYADASDGVDAQSETWRDRMAAIGHHLAAQRVRSVIFVHGTFVGDDPFALVHQWQSMLASLDPRLGLAIRNLTKRQLDRILGDAGNFNEDYIAFVNRALGDRLPCRPFVWSSSNHHIARLRAAARLVLDLAQTSELSESRARALLIGHSHASQVFALTTHLLARSRIGRALLERLAQYQEDDEARRRLDAAIASVSKIRLDFVTLGAPLRYGYCLRPRRQRLLHLINHRGDEPRGGSLAGVLHTSAGDYIQQWGVAGSDLAATTSADQEANRHLDEFLGVGANTSVWLDNVRFRARVHRDGHTVLVDYRDASPLAPNFHTTGLGHSVYTTQRMLRFNFDLIVDRLYPTAPTRDESVARSKHRA